MQKKINGFIKKKIKTIKKHKYVRPLVSIIFSSNSKTLPFQSKLDTKRRDTVRRELDQFVIPGGVSQKISIIMPTYNRGPLIACAIRSILQQTYTNFELIIVDDGSTDRTREVVESFEDARIRYVFQQNKGVSAARNTGLSHAEGQYIAYLDSDNEWRSRYLEYSIKSSLKYDKSCIYSVLTVVDDKGSVKSYRASDFDRARLWDRNFIDLNVFFHKFDRSDFALFDSRLRRAVDWDYIVRVTGVHDCYFSYFDECEYSDVSDESRLTLSAYSLYTKIVRAKNYFYATEEREILRLARLSVGIVIAAPASERAKWGDYYYGRALQKYLIDLGYNSELVYADTAAAARRKFDVNIVLRGRRKEKNLKHQMNILWVISHPEDVSAEECSEYDHVFAASKYFESLLRFEGVRNVSTLTQASDPEVFNDADKSDRSGIIFVGRTKGVDRRFVVDLVKGIDDAHVIGDGWEKFIDAEKIEAQWVQYPRLPTVYRSKDVVLAEHWRSMRLFGIIANRVSDAVGCGARVLSDKVRGDEHLQGRQYRSCVSSEDAFETLERWESLPDLSTASASVSMKDQATTIDNLIASLAFRFQPSLIRDEGGNRLIIYRGEDWKTYEWALVNTILPKLKAQALIDLSVRYDATAGLSRSELNGSEIALGDLYQSLTGQAAYECLNFRGLDERLWRLFSVGKHKPVNSRIATVIASSVDEAFSQFQEVFSKFDQVRVWDPLLMSRVSVQNGEVRKRGDYSDSARARIRRYLLDAEGIVTAIGSSTEATEFFHHVGLATGTYVLSPFNDAVGSIAHSDEWDAYFLPYSSLRDGRKLVGDLVGDELRQRYWEKFCDREML